jgi:23S rRNA pseudouridine2605 synthase
VGRLDRNTTGLLLFTNDGQLAGKLSHPSHKVRKIYRVTLDKPVSKSDLDAIALGVKLEDGVVEIDDLAFLNKDKTELGLELHSGKNRIVRRLFESLKYDVIKLDRAVYAGLTKKNLARGRWRFLTEREIGMLNKGL